MAILTYIDQDPLFETVEEALAFGSEINKEGFHTHQYNNQTGYMAGTTHKQESKNKARVTGIETIPKIKFKDSQAASREIKRKFGRPEDYAELHILSINNQVLRSDFNFTNFNTPPEGLDTLGLSSQINMDPAAELTKLGYNSGKFKIKLNLLRRKIFNTSNLIFSIKEISTSRTELRLKYKNYLIKEEVISSVRSFIGEIEANVFFKDFSLNFNDSNLLTAINIALDETSSIPEILIKLLDPLPSTYKILDELNIVEEIIDPSILTIDLGLPSLRDNTVPLKGPNFRIDTRLNSSIPSQYKTYDDILNNPNVLSSSYNQVLNYLENKEVPAIQYDYIRPISGTLETEDIPYHFENFIHFSNATERLKNFEYKLKLIELYDIQERGINTIEGPTSESHAIITDKALIQDKKNNLLKGLDGYENFLYFTSGTYAWPKQNITAPYELFSVTSSEAKTWLGSEESVNEYYGGQLLSSSLFDRQNPDSLDKIVPLYLMDNPDNNPYRLFIYMVGQQIDQVWTHIKHITEIRDTHHKRGISKDLVYFALKSLGLEAFDQFENSNLIEYILGQGNSGSAFYDTPTTQTLISASNGGSIPKQDISKEIWKRLYHNVPYLLKTKGTERGIKALMSCYGIPSTLLNVKEYGGPTKDVDVLSAGYKVFSYEKSGLALGGNTYQNLDSFAKTNWSSSLTDALSASAKTIEVRIKPHRLDASQGYGAPGAGNHHVIGLSGFNDEDQINILIENYTGDNISSSNDTTQYGRLTLYSGSNFISSASTDYFPLFNGDFWNIYMSTEGTSGSSANINFGAYQANFNKNISSFTSTYLQPEYHRALTFGDPYSSSGAFIGGAQFCRIGGESNATGLGYSGSIQELRYYFGEALSNDTLIKHALEPFMYAGNTTSSAYDNIVLRLPLGSNDQQDSSSFHPNIDVNYLSVNPEPELVINGNFEYNDNWEAVSGNELNVEQSSTYANGGNYSWKYTSTAGNQGIKQTLDPTKFEEGQIYVVSWDIYVVGLVGFNYNQVMMPGFHKVNGTVHYTGATNLQAGQWVSSTYRFVKESGGAQIRISNGGSYNGTNQTYYIDNVSVKKETNPVESNVVDMKWEEILETHHLPTPDTVGASMTSEKVRIDTGTIDDNLLSTTIKSETSVLDRQPQDFEDLGVFFSPTTEINEDIIYQLGTFRLDDFIGSPLPSAQTSPNYKDLAPLRKEYFKRYKDKYNYWDYTKLIQYVDHTLFKLIEQFVPAKANLKTGLLIEPHYLERNKFARELPVIEDGITMTPGSYQTFDLRIDPERQFTLEGAMGGGNVVTTNNLLNTTGSDGQRQEQGTNFVINVSGHILDEPQEAAQAPIKPFNSANNFGPELVFNGDFETGDLSNFTVGGSFPVRWTINGTKARLQSISTNVDTLTQFAVLEVGKTYRITFNAEVNVGGEFKLEGSNGNPIITINESRFYEEIFTAETTYLRFSSVSTISDILLDNISVKERLQSINSTTGKPKGYFKRTSNALLGNVVRGRKSSIYYRSLQIGNQSDIII